MTWREEPRDWRAQANCSDLDDPEVMFPHPADEDGIAAARFVCAGCPVAITCLNEALGETDAALAADHGVFGGMTPEERRREKRRRQERRRRGVRPVRAGEVAA